MFQHATKVNLFTPRVNTFTHQGCNVLYMKLGERIKAARLAAGYKRQKDLSDALGCERATVTKSRALPIRNSTPRPRRGRLAMAPACHSIALQRYKGQ